MLFRRNGEGLLGDIDRRLERVDACSTDLFGSVLDKLCPRLQRTPALLERVRRFVQAGAYTDAALTIIQGEIPSWQLRRLFFDSGEWHCMLCRTPWAPMDFDDKSEAHHECLPLAILRAFITARSVLPISSLSSEPSLPKIRADYGVTVCCDNFS